MTTGSGDTVTLGQEKKMDVQNVVANALISSEAQMDSDGNYYTNYLCHDVLTIPSVTFSCG